MDAKTIAVSVVSIAIACLFAVTLLIPIVADSTAETDTFTNEGYFRMSHYDNTTDHTMVWTYSEPNTVTVDGDDVLIDYHVPQGAVTLIADTDWIFRLYIGNDGNPVWVDYIPSSGGTVTRATVSDNATLTISLTSGSMSADFGNGTTKSGSYTDIWIPSNTGEYTMKKADKTAYINGDSEIVGYGISRPLNHAGQNVPSPGYGLAFIGSYDDGITGTIWRGTNGAISDTTVNATAEDSHNDLYIFDKITATFTLTETVDEETVTTDTELTYNYVIVPYEVTAERSIHPDANTNALLNLIPLLVVVGIILGTVGFIALRK